MMWQKFIEVMTAILNLYKQLLALTKQKRMVIVQVQMKELEALLSKEQLLVDAISKREKQRVDLLAELLADNNITDKADKMLDLLKYCDKETGQRIVEIHTELTETLRVLTTESKLNNNLVRQALGVVNYKLNVLSGAKVEQTYEPQGSEKVVNTRSCLNFEA